MTDSFEDRATEYMEGLEGDLVGCWVQVGFVNSVRPEGRRFFSLGKAYRRILKENRENAIILWNGIPVALSYGEDIPDLVKPLVEMLGCVIESSSEERRIFLFNSKNMKSRWYVRKERNHIELLVEWKRVKGGYKKALNKFGPVRMRRQEFLNEWKLLLSQLIESFTRAEAVLISRSARRRYRALLQLESAITGRGRFYQY